MNLRLALSLCIFYQIWMGSTLYAVRSTFMKSTPCPSPYNTSLAKEQSVEEKRKNMFAFHLNKLNYTLDFQKNNFYCCYYISFVIYYKKILRSFDFLFLFIWFPQ
jgi:hypothetical protein